MSSYSAYLIDLFINSREDKFICGAQASIGQRLIRGNFCVLVRFLAHIQVADLGPALLGVTALATAAGAALGAWLATEKLRADQLKRVIALVLLAVALKTAWGVL